MENVVYIYDRKYTREEFQSAIIDNKDYIDKLLESKVMLHKDNLGIDESTELFEKKTSSAGKESVTPQFVGMYIFEHNGTRKEIISLPKHLDGLGDEEKYRKVLFALFYKFKEELSLRDNLFDYSEWSNRDIALANRIKDYYLEYGIYTEKYMTNKTKHGRISWANTVKKVMPVIIDNAPIYTNFVYQNVAERSTEITRIELSILKYFLDSKLIDDIEIPDDFELYDEKDFADRKDYFLNVLRNEQSNVFDDVKLDRLQLMISFIEDGCVYDNNNNEYLKDEDVYKIAGNQYKNKTDIDNIKVFCKTVGNREYKSKKGNILNYPQYYVRIGRKKYIIGDDSSREYLSNNEPRMKENKFYSISIQKKNGFWNVTAAKELNEQPEQESSVQVYAIAQYSKVFEVLLAHYFDHNKGIQMSKDGVQSFKSNLLGKEITDVNDINYRPYVKTFYSDTMKTRYEDIMKNNIAYDRNFIDVAFDWECVNGEKYSVIIDAKDYDWYNDIMPSIPTSESIFKQFQYENIMERIYNDKGVKNINQYNVFILPAFKEKEGSDILWWSSTKDKKSMFTVYGHISDKLKEQSIICLRVDVEALTEAVLGDNVSDSDFITRKNKFVELLEEYKQNSSDKDNIYYSKIE